jgi:THO complex subunit 2
MSTPATPAECAERGDEEIKLDTTDSHDVSQPENSAHTHHAVYDYLPDEIVQQWDQGGQDKLLSEATAAVNGSDVRVMITLFYEILLSCSSMRLPWESAKEILKVILQLESSNINLTQIFLHTYSLFPTVDSSLSELLLSLDIDKSLLLLLLEPSTLVSMGVAHSLYEKRIVRANTNLLYKQKRFNLLREESEGYTKLLVEVHSAAHSRSNASKVVATANAIESLIGYFDLDPVRSLDIILDVAASNLAKYSEFFIKMLKISRWWPSTPAVGLRSMDDISQGGNPMAAQLLGFKMQFYNDNMQSIPDGVMMLTALLIKEGFICFGDIYNFLQPSDSTVDEYEGDWKKEMEEKSFLGTASALALAAPLADDTAGMRTPKTGASTPLADKQKDEKIDKTMGIEKPKVALLRCLLSVGSLHPSLYILTRFPYLPGAFPELADLIHRLVDYCIQPLYESVRNFAHLNAVSKPLPCSAIKETVLALPNTPFVRSMLNPLAEGYVGDKQCQFFYPNWTTELQQINDTQGLLDISELLVKFSGPLLSRSIPLLVRICRIGTFHLRDDTSDSAGHAFWLEYFRNFILPCLSLIETNPGAMYEIYSLMRRFSFEERFSLYGEWYAVLSKSSPHLKLATSKADKDTKNVLKRLSKTNVKEMMRKLAKISYSNPLPSFMAFLNQVESYDNLGELVVEAARYFTDMAWDALPFVIMTQLTSGRGTQQVDGMKDRKWIQCM